MYIIGKLDIDIYQCVSLDIITNEVVITDRQIEHIKERHPNDYEQYFPYFAEIVAHPDYIIEANKENTAVVLKELNIANESFKVIIRLATSADDPTYKNSIITFMKIDDKDWNRLLRNKQILYKRE